MVAFAKVLQTAGKDLAERIGKLVGRARGQRQVTGLLKRLFVLIGVIDAARERILPEHVGRHVDGVVVGVEHARVERMDAAVGMHVLDVRVNEKDIVLEVGQRAGVRVIDTLVGVVPEVIHLVVGIHEVAVQRHGPVLVDAVLHARVGAHAHFLPHEFVLFVGTRGGGATGAAVTVVVLEFRAKRKVELLADAPRV